MSTRTGLSNKLSFLVVQEGIWKNQASERLRGFLAARFGDRAEIELRYIRLLQDWLDDLEISIDHNDGSDSYMDTPIFKSLTGCLKTEARSQINARQRIYNAIMNDLGPYSAIRREVTSDNKSLKWAEEKFNDIDRQRLKSEKEQRLHTEKKEHFANQIEALENQLSQRSRITSARRSNRQGAKKVDAMRHRVSFLRKQVQEEEENIKTTQRELVNLEAKCTSDLGEMELLLKDLERTRIQNVTQQTRMFIQSMLNQQTQARRSACTADTLRQCLTEITEVEREVHKNWEDVEVNAQRSQAGQTFKLRQLFEVPKARPKSADSRKSHDSVKIAEIEACRLNEGLDEIAHRHDSPNPDTPLERKSLERKLSVEDFSKSTTKQPMKTSTHARHMLSEVCSETSIEDLHLPPETKNVAIRPTVSKDFWFKSELSDSTEEKQNNTVYTQIREVDRSRPLISPGPALSDIHTFGTVDVGQLRNIRVIAKVGYTARADGELSFKKGQIIKQKAAENDAGFCFGWTRDHMLFPKRYGYYPKAAVAFQCYQEK